MYKFKRGKRGRDYETYEISEITVDSENSKILSSNLGCTTVMLSGKQITIDMYFKDFEVANKFMTSDGPYRFGRDVLDSIKYAMPCEFEEVTVLRNYYVRSYIRTEHE